MILDRSIQCEPQERLKQNTDGNRLSLLSTRIVRDANFRHCSVSRGPVDVIFLSNTTSTNTYVFPLYQKDGSPNINPEFIDKMHQIGIALDCHQ